jgi:hypothetical protein
VFFLSSEIKKRLSYKLAHHKYIKKNGKVYGPYLYETKRVNGKVITSYLGVPEDETKNNWSKITVVRVFILVLIVFFSLILFSLPLLLVEEVRTGEFFSEGIGRVFLRGIGIDVGEVLLAPPGQGTNGMLVFRSSDTVPTTAPEYRVRTGGNWGTSNLKAIDVGATIYYIKIVNHPTSSEKMLCTKDGGIDCQVWDGNSWGNFEVVSAISGQNFRDFDICYESQSGDAFVFYRNNANINEVFYKTWNGISWGSQQSAFSLNNEIATMRCFSDKNSDYIAIMGKDYDGVIEVAIWDGGLVEAGTFSPPETAGQERPMAYSGAWESLSGDFVFAYVDEVNNRVEGNEYDKSTGFGSETTIISTFFGGGPYSGNYLAWIELEANPISTSNEILMAAADEDELNLEAVRWSGSSWGTPVELDANVGALSGLTRAFDIAYEGLSGEAIITHDRSAGFIEYNIWNGATWGSAQSLPDPNDPSQQIDWHFLASDSDSDRIMLTTIGNQDPSDISTLEWDGQTNSWESSSSYIVHDTFSDDEYMNAWFAYESDFVTTPPTINFVSPTPAHQSTIGGQDIGVAVSSSDDNVDHFTFVEFENDVYAWYPFNDGTANDYLGTNHGVIPASPNDPSITLAKFGNGMQFDAVQNEEDYIDIPFNGVGMGSDKGSVSLWFKTSNTDGGDILIYGSEDLGANGNGFGEENELHLGFGNPSNTQIIFNIYQGAPFKVQTSGSYVDGNWHHVVATWEAGNEVRLYVDGSEIGTGAPYIPAFTFDFDVTFRLGRPADTQREFNGDMDEVIVFDRVLTLAEVQSLFEANANQYSNTFTGLTDGTYNFRGHASDLAGNIALTLDGGGARQVTLATMITVDEIGDGVAGDTVAPFSVNVNMPTVKLTTNEDANCFGSLSDENYDDMSDDIDCTGDGTISHVCSFTTPIPDSVSQGMHFACQDTAGNKNTVGNNADITVEIDKISPALILPGVLDPVEGSTIGNSQTIMFTTDEIGDCKWSLADEAYSMMAGDCTGDGTASHSCSVSGMVEGPEVVYISCRDDTDYIFNEDGMADNDELAYTVQVNQPPTSRFLDSGTSPTGNTPLHLSTVAVDNFIVDLESIDIDSDPDGHYAFLEFDTDAVTVGLQSDLVLWMRMDDNDCDPGPCTTVTDLSNYNNDGVLQGTPVPSLVPGKYGNAFDFILANSNTITVTDDTSLDVGSKFTIAAWIRTDKTICDPIDPGIQCRIVQKGSGDVVNSHYVLHLRATGAEDSLEFCVDGGAVCVQVSETVFDNQWHFVAGTYDGATLSLYVDDSVPVTSGYIASIADINDPVSIGGRPDLNEDFFDGDIDEVFIFGRALSSQEILALYKAGETGGVNQYSGSFSGLADGTYDFEGQAVDVGGLIASPVTRTVTVNTEIVVDSSSNANDVSLTVLGEEKFVVGWVQDVGNNFNFKVYDTDGTELVGETIIEGGATVGTDSRISVAAVDATRFISTFVNSDPTPANQNVKYAVYDDTGTVVKASTLLANIDNGLRHETSVTTLALESFACYVDGKSGADDAEFWRIDSNFIKDVNRIEIDGGVAQNTDTTISENHFECTSIGTNRWVGAFINDLSNVVYYNVMDAAGGFVGSVITVDANVGEAGQVAVTSLDQNKFAIAWYDSVNSRIQMSLRSESGLVASTNYNLNEDGIAGLDSLLVDAAAGTTTSVTARVAMGTVKDSVGNDMIVVAWNDRIEGEIKAAVYDNAGILLHGPYTLANDEHGTDLLFDIYGRDSANNIGLCDEKYLLAYTNDINEVVVERFDIDGTAWNGVCNPDLFNPVVNFVDPPSGNTPADLSNVYDDFTEIDVEITEENLDSFNFKWDDLIATGEQTDFSIYDDTLLLMMNFDNVPGLGETYGHNGTVRDVSSYGNDGVPQDMDAGNGDSTTMSIGSGKYNGAWHFGTNGFQDDLIEIDDSSEMLIDDGSISFWLMPFDVVSVQGLFSKDSQGLDQGGHLSMHVSGWVLGTPGVNEPQSNDAVNVRLQNKDSGVGDSGSFYVSSGDSSIVVGQWYHVLFTFGSQGMKLYMDGVEVDSDPYTGGMGTSGGGTGNTEPIALGAATHNSGDGTINVANSFLNGRIDEVRMWNRQLNDDEVREMYYSNLNKSNTDKWFFETNQSGLVEDISYSFSASAIDMSANSGSTETRTINVKKKLEIMDISDLALQNVNPGTTANVPFTVDVFSDGGQGEIGTVTANFTASDPDGPGGFEPAVRLDSDNCNSPTDIGGNVYRFNCAIDIQYYDIPGTWRTFAGVGGLGGQAGLEHHYGGNFETPAETFVLGTTFYINHPNSLSWGSLSSGTSPDSIVGMLLRNWGNGVFSQIDLEGGNLLRQPSGPEEIPIEEFWFDFDVPKDSCDEVGDATQMTISQQQIPGLDLPVKDEVSENGERTVDICLTDIPAGLPGGNYLASGVNSWEIFSTPAATFGLCGNNIIESGELCECGVDEICGNADDDTNSNSCTTPGISGGPYSGGTLYCGGDCTSWDTSACVP